MTPLPLLRPLVTRLEDDIRAFSSTDEDTYAHLRAEHQRARDANRTAHAYSTWQDEQVTLSAVAWVLACVFIRFSEDNGLIPDPLLSGEGDRLSFAQDQTTRYFQENPSHSDREYLLWVFSQVAALPGMGDLFDERHNPLFKLPPSVEGAKDLLRFWRQLGPEGALALSFNDPKRETRFLGDLYQDLSDDAKKRYALLQTPHFIESFILDRTLEPAIQEFGLKDTDLIDPACGSGHFLLGAFERLLGHWQELEPDANTRILSQRALDQIAGVDLNPFAAAIARFRLLVAALNASEITALRDAPDFKINVTAGDSLLHGRRPGRLPVLDASTAREEHQHIYEAEDEQALRAILDRRYAAVVANPPYITPKDPAANQAYRDRFESCHRQYALSVPFMERLFDLARPAEGRSPAGFIGQITSNSFMKREFGTKLIEEFLPDWDLTHLIDTSGAYIPGHGTPTVILFARAQAPRLETVRGVLGIRGEPGTPEDPAKAQVWTEINELVDQPDAEGEFVSTEDLERARLATHPWSLQGGGAGHVKALMDRFIELTERTSSIGKMAVTGNDEVFTRQRRGALSGSATSRPLISGDNIRDWSISSRGEVIWPYDEGGEASPVRDPLHDLLWRWRTNLSSALYFGSTPAERGHDWAEFSILVKRAIAQGPTLGFAEVATHNHFAIEHGPSVFRHTAPVMRFDKPALAQVALGFLNSSSACFWIKQVSHNKGSTVDSKGARQTTDAFENFYQHDATKLQRFPLPKDPPVELARRLDALGQELGSVLPASVVEESAPARSLLDDAHGRWTSIRRQMIALQEELDWRCYRLYGLIEDDLVFSDWDALPEVDLGERAFEIALARRIEAGETETRWFERHRSTSTTEIPERFSAGYQDLLQRRLDAIESNKSIRLIERPEYKRRWQTQTWQDMETDALRSWLCDQLESDALWSQPELLREDQVADRLASDAAFQEALVLYAGENAEPGKVIASLLAEEAVPYLARLRYTDSGMRKREAWEETWELQRAEDRGEKVEIDVPPKYKKTDFRSGRFWTHRGKLDVPKERFVSYPKAARDGSDLYGWAGWDDAERSQAVAARIVEAQEREGLSDEIMTDLLDGLRELLPWVYQWHPEVDPNFGSALGDIYSSFLDERERLIGSGG